MKLFPTVIICILVGFFVGMMFSGKSHMTDMERKEEENKELRRKLLEKIHEVTESRKELAFERAEFEKNIRASQHRIDSLEQRIVANDKKYISDMRQLQKRSLKQLEDEAERIYRNSVTAAEQ